jgi:anti-sigma factor RsiW
MICDDAGTLLHALLDGELDAGHARDVETHLAGCAHCAAQFKAHRELRQNLQMADLRFAAPMSLRNRIDRVVPPANSTSRRTLLKGFAAGTALSGAVAASLVILVIRHEQSTRILGEAVSAHLRSLQGDHLTDVLSTDQHTVKPWFNGRVDFAPPVIDLTAQGFTLIGGRLDYIDGKPVGVIVYRRRTHVINLFVGKDFSAESGLGKLHSVQGFNIRRWSASGLDLLAVSDINQEELEEFGTRFEAVAQ